MKNERKLAYIVPRPYGTKEEVKEHVLACCRYAARQGYIPVIDPDIYPDVLKEMDATGALLSVFYAAGTPFFECDCVMIFTKAVRKEIREIRYQAGILGIRVIDCVRERLPYPDTPDKVIWIDSRPYRL